MALLNFSLRSLDLDLKTTLATLDPLKLPELVVKWSSFADLLDAKMPLFDALVEEGVVGVGVAARNEAEASRVEEVSKWFSGGSGGDNDGDVTLVDAFGRVVDRGQHIQTAENVKEYLARETEVSSVFLREAREKIGETSREKRETLLSDVAQEYKSVPTIFDLFAEWKREYRADFTRSFAGLTVHQAVFPFVKMQLVDWNPFSQNAQRIDDQEWHHLLTQTSDFDEIEGNNEPTDPLIFLVVKKAVFPHVKKLVPTIDLFSSRAVTVFYELEEYSSRKSAAFKMLRINAGIDGYTLVAHMEMTCAEVVKAYPVDMTKAVSGPPVASGGARDAVFCHAFK
ncbi:GC-rich sequence DNA-binding factor, partial [Rhizoclosmatium sp. JEL0117]